MEPVGDLLGDQGLFGGFLEDERRVNHKTPTIIRITGHHWAISGPRHGSQPRFFRRKIIPRAIRMYAPNPDLDFITPPRR
jgi:hypothetical protein